MVSNTLQVTVLMAAGAQRNRRTAGDFLFLTTVGNHCLMPLIFTAAEYPIKVLHPGSHVPTNDHCTTD